MFRATKEGGYVELSVSFLLTGLGVDVYLLTILFLAVF